MKIKQRSKKQLNKNLRWHSLVLLDKIENHNEFSNVVIDEFLQNTPLDERDNRLVVQIVYGVIQNKLTIDYYLAPFVSGKKLDDWVSTLLRLSVYQLVFLDRIPSHAVVNEAVQVAKVNGHGGVGNFVNAILRRFIRTDRLDIDAIEDFTERLSVKYSISPWIVDYFLKHQTHEEVENLLESLQEVPFISARVNTSKKSRKEVMESLYSEGYDTVESDISPVGIRSMNGNLIHSTAFKEGWLTIQDESSMLVAPLGHINGDEEILDACSAPGGKATHIATLLETGHLTGLDLSEPKIKRVNEHMDRLGLSQRVTLNVEDASKHQPTDGQLYDKIYLDAPCSGLGLMRRKPEIKYDKSYKDIQELAQIQTELINHVSTLLKPGGEIIYSTCTMSYEENEEIVQSFLNAHDNFVQSPISAEKDNIKADLITDEGNIRVWPQQYHTDGFFISRLVKKDTEGIK